MVSITKVYHETKVFAIVYLRKEAVFLYKKFQALLEKSNETVYQVSKETGISQTAFSNWKSGRTSPNIDSLKKLSKHFNVPIEYFVDTADEERCGNSE